MARPSERRATQRAAQAEDRRPPALQQNRRFYTSGGFSDGVRAARALENAFKIGTEFKQGQMQAASDEGQRKAITDYAAGERDADNKTMGYYKQWEELDAEYDYNAAVKELPEILRGADWENMSEAQVQGLVSDYMRDQFAGIGEMTDSPYAQFMAPRLLELETKTIAAHRDMQIEKLHEEQRTKIYSNAETQVEATGQLDYEKLFTQTGVFFDSAMKKTIWLETVTDLAIRRGRPDLLEDMPEEINGIPTGKADPLLAPERRAALNAAYAQQARNEAKADAALAEQRDDDIFDTQLTIANKVLQGQDVSAEIGLLRDLDAGFAAVTTSMNFGDTLRGRAESASPQLNSVVELWGSIYKGDASLEDIMQADADGVFGFGEQREGTVKGMLSAVKAARASSKSANASQISTYRTELADAYNPSREGILKGLDPTISGIRNSAISMYNDLVLQQGKEPHEAAMDVFEKYDPMLDKMTNAKSRTTTNIELGTLTGDMVSSYLAGNMSADRLLQGQTRASAIAQLDQLVVDKMITEEAAGKIYAEHIQ